MIVKSATVVCPNCEKVSTIDFNDIEIDWASGQLLLSFECPDCGTYLENEAVEKEED